MIKGFSGMLSAEPCFVRLDNRMKLHKFKSKGEALRYIRAEMQKTNINHAEIIRPPNEVIASIRRS